MLRRKETILDEGVATERLKAVREAGLQPGDVMRLLEESVAYAPAAEAEIVVRALVSHIPDDQLCSLTARYLLPERPGGLEWPDATSAPHLLIEQLIPRGFHVLEDSAGWTVTTPDGESFTTQFRDLGVITTESLSLPSRGEALCRTALLASLVHVVRAGLSATDPDAS